MVIYARVAGAVKSFIHDAVSMSAERMACEKGAERNVNWGESSLCLHTCDINDPALIQDPASIAKLSPHTPGL